MTRDRKDEESEENKTTSHTDEKNSASRSSHSTRRETERTLSDIRIASVSSPLKKVYNTDTDVEPFRPELVIREQSFDDPTVTTVVAPSRATLDTEVERAIPPTSEIDRTEDSLELTTLETVPRETLTHEVTEPVELTNSIGQVETPQFAVARTPETRTIEQTVDRRFTLTRNSSSNMTEKDLNDPVFSWSDSPYNTRRPKLVLHRELAEREEGVSSFALLQRLLRDTYTELEGGEPSSKTATVRSDGDLRVPDVENSIVTLDLAGEDFQPSTSVREEQPTIKYDGIDIVPELRKVTSTLYSGDLGYFLVNVPDEWEYEGDISDENFFEKLRTRLTEQSKQITEDERESPQHTFDESPPVIVATPRIEDAEPLATKTAEYFSLGSYRDKWSTVDQFEASQSSSLRQSDWKRVALTEKQPFGDESDEHYFWKAAIAEGLARQIFDDNQREFENFEQFIREQETIKTEEPLDGDRDGDTDPTHTSDILVDETGDQSLTIAPALREFLSKEGQNVPTLAIEFETGRSEGAFNFRKIRDSLEKYSGAGVSADVDHVALAVPQRLLFRGRSRATMIYELVDEWDESENVTAGLYVPDLDAPGGSCRELQRVDEDYINNLYEGDEDE